jgi:predicted cupin superfamily sugar epimerase
VTADELIAALGLAPHPEGGFFAETFRSQSTVSSEAHVGGVRSAVTAIYFLLRTNDFSALHRVRSDEVWHHYLGDPLVLSLIRADGGSEHVLLGRDLRAGQRPQLVVPAGVYQGGRPTPGPAGYVLCGCTVAPGFEFRDFEMPSRDALLALWPQHRELIGSLTR